MDRRNFIVGTVALAGTARAQGAQYRYRLGLSQPLDSPNYLRLKEMADRVQADTGGAMQIEVLGAGALGSDNQMLAMVQKGELELYMAGNVWGPLVPVTEMPGCRSRSRRHRKSSRRSTASSAITSAARCWRRAFTSSG